MLPGQWDILHEIARSSDDTPPSYSDAAEAAIAEIERLKSLLVRKTEALDVFASQCMWVRYRRTTEDTVECNVIEWNGADRCANPMTFAAAERDADEPCDRA